jgi:hypothetical protein
VKRISLASESWMYYYEIDKVADEALREAEKCVKDAQTASKPAEQVDLSEAEKAVQAESGGEIEKPTTDTEKIMDQQGEETQSILL